MTPHLAELRYTADGMLDLFTSLANQEWSMLLYSGDRHARAGRFDILVAEPSVKLETIGGITKISDGSRSFTSGEDPLALLQRQMELSGLSSTSLDPEVPFQGGALGFFSYDLMRLTRGSSPGMRVGTGLPDMAVGIYRWAVISDHLERRLFLISQDDPQPTLEKLTRRRMTSPTSSDFHLLDIWKTSMSRAEYGEKFNRIKHHISLGDCYQVCLSLRFEAPYGGDEWSLFCQLIRSNLVPFAAFIRLSPKQVVLSLSPERFISLSGREICSRPIKGTVRRSSDPAIDRLRAEELARCPKNKAENLMIVDLVRNDIGRVAQPGSVRVPSIFAVETFDRVHHLVSTVTGTLSPEYSGLDLLRSCLPGGSVTGAPKIRAMELIEQLEPHRRGVWCGSIGYVSCCGKMDTSVAIRTITAEDGRIYTSFGGAVTSDSTESAEYAEIEAKASSIVPILGEISAARRTSAS